LIGPSQKKVETMEPPQNRRFYGKMECLPFDPPIWVRKGEVWAKHMGLYQGAIGNTLGNTLGT
jgi:hypothetical protein